MTTNPTPRVIPDRLTSPLSRALRSWEALLFAVAVAVFIANSFASPYFLNAWNLSDATFNFTEKALIAFAMALLIIAGEIDLSVAAIIALASTAMGYAAQYGVGAPGLVAIGITTGLACGAFNGLLVAGLKLPSIVVTIGTMSLFRGISYLVLGDQAFGKYPPEFAFFGQGYVFWVISFEFVLFLVMALMQLEPEWRSLTWVLGAWLVFAGAACALGYASLLAQGGLYAHLHRMQFREPEAG